MSGRLYRVLDGPLAGQLVPQDDTCICDEDLNGCGGTGWQWLRRGDDEEEKRRCPQCGGVGRVLGYPDDGRRPSRLAVVENESVAVEATPDSSIANLDTASRGPAPLNASRPDEALGNAAAGCGVSVPGVTPSEGAEARRPVSAIPDSPAGPESTPARQEPTREAFAPRPGTSYDATRR